MTLADTIVSFFTAHTVLVSSPGPLVHREGPTTHCMVDRNRILHMEILCQYNCLANSVVFVSNLYREAWTMYFREYDFRQPLMYLLTSNRQYSPLKNINTGTHL